MEEDMFIYSPIVMFCGTPCMYSWYRVAMPVHSQSFQDQFIEKK